MLKRLESKAGDVEMTFPIFKQEAQYPKLKALDYELLLSAQLR